MPDQRENAFFVLEGSIVRAAQSTLDGALHYMLRGRILLWGSYEQAKELQERLQGQPSAASST